MPQGFKSTESGKYKLSDDAPMKVLVREGNGVQRPSTPPPAAFAERTGKRYQDGADTFEEYRAKPGSTTRDCLNTAEEVMHQKQLKPFAEDYSREKVTQDAFGGSAQANISTAQQARQKAPGSVNDNAAPGKGEGFVSVREREVDDGARHHAEGVWGTDGRDRLTMHVWSDGSAKSEKRQHTPDFKKYSTDPNAPDTFHKTWKDAFGGDPVTTTVLEKKD
ncbi:hypothetical protein [Corallococcus sp. EGB]|uniref:hypothetical protein n=1 Tax=Corallococcus sp. EGB TaxID=1521117 RepID=UPI001CC118E4|nr:hypothetical protein [Corallococcus sp. EGB]